MIWKVSSKYLNSSFIRKKTKEKKLQGGTNLEEIMIIQWIKHEQ